MADEALHLWAQMHIVKCFASAKRFHLPERANFVAYLLYGRYAEVFSLFVLVYSVLSATTGSLFAALFAGIRPEMQVRRMLSAIRISALDTGSAAILA